MRRIRRGVVVAEAAGPVDAVNHTPGLGVSVEDGDASLVAAAARVICYLRRMGRFHATWQLVDRRVVDLPVGRAVRISSRERPPSGFGAVPSHSVEYVLRLDGKTVSIGGTAPIADHALPHTIDAIARDVVRS